MNQPGIEQARLRRMENILSGLLRYGALLACILLLIGMALNEFANFLPGIWSQAGHFWLTGGIIFLIALPVLRVAVMGVIFLLERDLCFAAISAGVLLIIAFGFLVGALGSGQAIH